MPNVLMIPVRSDCHKIAFVLSTKALFIFTLVVCNSYISWNESTMIEISLENRDFTSQNSFSIGCDRNKALSLSAALQSLPGQYYWWPLPEECQRQLSNELEFLNILLMMKSRSCNVFATNSLYFSYNICMHRKLWCDAPVSFWFGLVFPSTVDQETIAFHSRRVKRMQAFLAVTELFYKVHLYNRLCNFQ